MKRTFTIILTLVSFVTFAQPTITSSVAGGIGDEFSTTHVTVTDFDPGAAGTGITWDFSGISTTGTTTTFTFVTPASTGFAGDFPEANTAGDA